MQAIVDTIAAFIQSVINFFSPIVVICISSFSIIAFLLGALADPQGLMNQTICGAIDYIAALFPSTPDNLKIGNLINLVGDSIPLFGRGLVREVFTTISSMVAITFAIKIYKLLPFKAT